MRWRLCAIMPMLFAAGSVTECEKNIIKQPNVVTTAETDSKVILSINDEDIEFLSTETENPSFIVKSLYGDRPNKVALKQG